MVEATHGRGMTTPAPDLEAFLDLERRLGPAELAKLAAAARSRRRANADARTIAMAFTASALVTAGRTDTWLGALAHTARSARERPRPVDVPSLVDAALTEAAIADAAVAIAAWDLVGIGGFTVRQRDALMWTWVEAFGPLASSPAALAA